MTRTIKKVISFILAFAVLFSFVGCNQTAYVNSDNVIEANELKDLLSDTSTIVIDARSPEDYKKGHLQGAVLLPPSELTISDPVPGIIAPKEQVEAVLGERGITNRSKVYIYDNNGGVNASRVWWVMKVYGHDVVKVVNNGETAIVKSKLSLSTDVPETEPAQYTAADQDAVMMAAIDDVQSVIDEKMEGTIVDVRSRAEYDEGAIPTAVLYPHTNNLYSDGTFKSPRDTYLDYHDLGLDREDTIILYCKTSFRAAQTALVLKEAGFTNVKIYDGAWSEWSTKDMPKSEQKENNVVPTVQDAS